MVGSMQPGVIEESESIFFCAYFPFLPRFLQTEWDFVPLLITPGFATCTKVAPRTCAMGQTLSVPVPVSQRNRTRDAGFTGTTASRHFVCLCLYKQNKNTNAFSNTMNVINVSEWTTRGQPTDSLCFVQRNFNSAKLSGGLAEFFPETRVVCLYSASQREKRKHALATPSDHVISAAFWGDARQKWELLCFF